MLQEVLLCLAGYQSPFLEGTLTPDPGAIKTDEDLKEQTTPALSPPERALLSTAAHLGNLHRKIKEHAASISASHSSMICRAVASSITSTQLRRFMAQILATERSILTKDSAYVSGYGIVPLSTVIGDFAPWKRRLEWLWEVVYYIQPASTSEESWSSQPCVTGSSIIDFLRKESHTGYVDIEATALELLKSAEMVWLQQLSTWVLYGQRPSFGSDDFFIQSALRGRATSGLELSDVSIDRKMLPDFVSPETASSTLFIVKSLGRIRVHGRDWPGPSCSADPAIKLLPTHLDYLKNVQSPISSSSLTSAISSIRVSISQNALSQLLPLSEIAELLHVLQDFLLLRRGEFAVSLISNAEKRISGRQHSHRHSEAVRKSGRLGCQSLKDEDFGGVLSQTWSELLAMQSEDLFDGTLDKGREMLRIVAKEVPPIPEHDQADFSSLVFAIPASLTVPFQPTSPLALFLSPEDMSSYAEINSYLLGIRRASMHIESLWKLTGLRRSSGEIFLNPNAEAAAQKLAGGRLREDQRWRRMRPAWATASKARLVLMELGAYLQGRIAHGHSQHFLSWVLSLMEAEDLALQISQSGDSSSMNSDLPLRGVSHISRNSKASNSPAFLDGARHSTIDHIARQRDAATLAEAHRKHLASLRSSLLLNAKKFMKRMLELLRSLDHFVAFFARLQAAQQNFDLEANDASREANMKHSEEFELLREMDTGRKMVEEHLIGLIEELRNSAGWKDEDSPWEIAAQRIGEVDITLSTYVPWRSPNIDSLLMKLDFIGAESHGNALEDEEESYSC